ncbi:G-protein coupled receptor Mth2-like [Contarinia nasturtii]|uniref:G-protein coupled receptor Mth2-like n=1 Tax=Contarinia nasturtii TaxID=265458 RepID=UPI0012D452F1|nr:G-protein coupled receptor Mth2-like [Contarinia nasturtii]
MTGWRVFLVPVMLLIVSALNFNYNHPYKLQCDFDDSVNITDGVRQADDSILFDNIKYEKDTYKMINYTYTWESEVQTFRKTDAYIRGCIPKSKPFIRLFCRRGVENRNCPSHSAIRNHPQKIIDENNEEITVTLDDHFGFQFDAPCKTTCPEINYTLFYNGNVSISDDDSLNKNQYSLEFYKNNETNEIISVLHMCCKEMDGIIIHQRHQKTIINTGMVISEILLAITFLIYYRAKNLDRFYGDMLLCYLSGPVIAFALILFSKFNKEISTSQIYDALGYIVYFTFVSSFIWISVISFDLWKNLRLFHIHTFTVISRRKQLFSYMFYAYGLALFFTIFFHIYDGKISDAEKIASCFLDESSSSMCFIYYIPIWIIFIVSQAFFTLSKIQMHNSSDNEHRQSNNQKIKRQLSRFNDGDNFALYWRLHILICSVWVLEGASFILVAIPKIQFFANFLFALQGLSTFVIFVMNRHVLHLIHKSCQNVVSKTRSIEIEKNNSVRAVTLCEKYETNTNNQPDIVVENTSV